MRRKSDKSFLFVEKKITLTETGILLRKRAEEMLALYEKTQSEILNPPESISGEIYIGGGESHAIQIIAKVAKDLLKENPI